MRKHFLILALLGILISSFSLLSQNTKEDEELLRRSVLSEPPGFNPDPPRSSFPAPFVSTGSPIINPVTSPAISTGYYFVDSDDNAPDYWRPVPEWVDTNTDRTMWFRILSGPNQRSESFWQQNKDNGRRYFRNPANPNDSVDDAIAGPIPIGFPFYFNGIRYDSFYVSTNGIIALTNRRYFYNTLGQRVIPTGATTCYDPHSMDWFVRARSGNGLTDQTPDDFGYQYAVLGNDPTNPTGGIRQKGGALNTLPVGYRAAVIAPFFGDNHLSQFRNSDATIDDFGQAWFKRSINNDKLIIYFVNIAPVGPKATPFGTYNAQPNLRPGDQNFVAASAQVVLNRLDSSITIYYGVFEGRALVGGRPVTAPVIFRYNTTVGVRGFARHVNYNRGGVSPTDPMYPWAPASLNGEYEQFTHYFSNYAVTDAPYPKDWLAIKFKQWKNTLRVVDIRYRVRNPNPSASLDYTVEVPSTSANDYELLAGDERLGSLQPVAILQNLTNDIQGPQGVNFTPQSLNFRARFRIINKATQRLTYTSLINVDSLCLALPESQAEECADDPYVLVRYCNVSLSGGNYTATFLPFPGPNNLNGIPPYGFVQIFFRPFEPNEFIINNIGRLQAYIIADPTNPLTSQSLGDQWPFDDTTSVRIFVMKRLEEFYDDVTQFHLIDNVPMPSTLKWVNIEAEVAAGDAVSYYPLPPRGEFSASNNADFGFSNPDFTQYKLKSPVIRMTRRRLDGSEPPTSPGGDEIRSFPINLLHSSSRRTKGAVLSLSVQRAVKQTDWPRGWCDLQLVAPEPRTVINGDILRRWNYTYAVSTHPDELAVEFAKLDPESNGLQTVTNIPSANWRYHPRRGGSPVTNMAAYSIFGAGGARRGFDENNKDSVLIPETTTVPNGLRADLFDDGIDFEYKRIFVPIPDTFITAPNDGARNFRFRIRVLGVNGRKCATCIIDDDDPFIVDNVKITLPAEICDIEISTVKVDWPYTIVPASQAINIPVSVTISNNSSLNAPSFLVKLKIFRKGDELHPERAIYCRTKTIPFLNPGTQTQVSMPNWDARSSGPGEYVLVGNILVLPAGDLDSRNDTTYSEFTLRFGDVMAYDPVDQPRNDVPDNSFTGIPGKGLTLYGVATGGQGSVNGPSGTYNHIDWGSGYMQSLGNGQIAVKFELYQADTIYGYTAFFGNLNMAMDDIAFAIYTDQGQPGEVIQGSTIYRYRGLGDDMTEPRFNQYVKYLLPNPVVLPRGTYWIAIAQMSVNGIQLGASKSRSGMRTTSIYVPPPETSVNWVGAGGLHLAIDKSFRRKLPSGELINNNFFAFENTIGSGTWVPFFPTMGNPAYAHLHHFGITPQDNTTATLSRGSWIPMLRPYFGTRSFQQQTVYRPCDDDIPVEITVFNGIVRSSAIDLYWETASETDNYGFYVERKSSRDDEWKTITFVKGAGNSRSLQQYSYTDRDNLQLNTTYYYRLRQVDVSGVQSCDTYSNVIELLYDKVDEVVLEPNVPNPFSNATQISFNIPKREWVKLEVIDIFGNVVKTLVNSELDAKNHRYMWDGTASDGTMVSNGNYIYRLTVGGKVYTGKMTLIR